MGEKTDHLSTTSAQHAGGANAGVSPQGALGAPLTRSTALLFSVACGLAVANVYYAQPLLDTMADEFSLSHAAVVITVTQIGYGVGLILVVPLGDLLNRRRLIVTQSLLSVVALASVALAPTATMLLLAMAAVGLLAVVTQVLVAYAAILAPPSGRGRAVGTVTSGIIIGILLARSVAGTLSDLAGWRSVYLFSAAATLAVSALLFKALPRQPGPGVGVPYPKLIGSVFRLFVEEPVLRTRGVLAMLIFAAITILLTPMVLPLAAAPFSLTHTQVGLFGLAGAAGALGASARRSHGRPWLCSADDRPRPGGHAVVLAARRPSALVYLGTGARRRHHRLRAAVRACI